MSTTPIANSPLLSWDTSNLKYEESPHPTLSIRIPGFNHESFDREWNPKITSIMLTTSISRLYVCHKPLPSSNNKETQRQEENYLLDWPRLTEKFYMFASASEFVMSRSLYDKNVRKWPLDMKFTLGHVGNCSIAYTCEFFDCSNDGRHWRKTPLWTSTSQVVTVDKSTIMPARLPDWFMDKYKGKGNMEKGLVLKPFDRPAVTYVHPTVVQWTDTDYYYHTNWSTYARWAMDSLQAALRFKNLDSSSSQRPTAADSAAGKARAALHSITRDIVLRGIRKLQITFFNECLEGEELETHVWQDGKAEKELVYFSIVKNGEDVCQIKLWFFTSLVEEEEEEEFPF